MGVAAGPDARRAEIASSFQLSAVGSQTKLSSMIVNSARELAYAINDIGKPGLTPRPWNIYSPDDTFWWLVPTTEWPAYRYGKYAFSHPKDVPRKNLRRVRRVVAVTQRSASAGHFWLNLSA